MLPEPTLRVEPQLAESLRVGVVAAAPVRVGPAGPGLVEAIDERGRELIARHAGDRPSEVPGLAPARELYRAFGIDPTRHRPSSEALVRRVLRGKPFPRVSNAVDLGNLCSVSFLLPLGLYDAERIDGPVVLRRGIEGEDYEGIRKDRVRLAGRPVLADRQGPFGNPTSDSARTRVTERTSALWMVIFAPRSVSSEVMNGHAALAGRWIERHLADGGRVPLVRTLVPSGS